MGTTTKYEYLKAIKPRYKKATKRQKKLILDEFCHTCNYNRKYAIRLLNSKPKPKIRTNLSKRGRKKQYDHPMIVNVFGIFG